MTLEKTFYWAQHIKCHLFHKMIASSIVGKKYNLGKGMWIQRKIFLNLVKMLCGRESADFVEIFTPDCIHSSFSEN